MSGNKVVKAGLGYTIGNVLVRGIGFLSIPLFTRLMSTGDYGLYNTYAAYEAIFYLLISLALNSTAKIAKLEYKDNFDEYMSTIITIVILNAFVWLAIFNVVYPLIPGYIWEYNRLVLNILVVHSLGSALLVIFNAAISVRYKYKSYLAMSLLNSLGSIGTSVILMLTLFSDQRYMGRILGAVAGVSITGVIVLVSFYRRAKPNFRKGYVKYALKYSLPVVPHGISQVLLSQFDRIMIRNMAGEAQAGIYSFTGNVGSIMKVITNSVMTAWSPWFFEEYSKKNLSKIRETTKYCITGFALFTSGVMLCAPEVLKIMAPSDYWDGIKLVVPIALDVFCTLLYSIYCEIEYYYKKTQFLMFATMGAALINIVTNYIMIKVFGYVAAAWTTLFSYICYFAFHYCLSRKIAGEDVFELKSNVLAILETIAIAVFASVFRESWILRWGMAVVICAINFFCFKSVIVEFLASKRIQKMEK